MTKLSEARYKTLLKISRSGRQGTRPRGADLTTAYWLRQERLVETYRCSVKLQLQYRISDLGLEAIRKQAPPSPDLKASQRPTVSSETNSPPTQSHLAGKGEL